jgi:diacylglycerol kinase (ATP)
MIDLPKTLRSFRYAWAGIVALFTHENNARVHLTVALIVISAGLFWGISAVEWMLVGVAIGGVWAAEAFNTALEKLCDVVQPQQDPRIKAIKDLAAAGVFVMALVAVMIGLIIFGPRFIDLIT